MSQDKPSDAKSSPAKLTGAAAEPITGTPAEAKPATESQAVGKDADTKPTDKRRGNINPGATPATVSEPVPLSAGNRKESAIKQPVDALRRSPAGQDATNKNQTSTETAAKTAAQIETDTETNTATGVATGIKTTTPADTTGKAGAMNSNSDKKTDNKASTGTSTGTSASSSASNTANKGSGGGAIAGAIAGGTASSAESKLGTNNSTNPSTNTGNNPSTKSSAGKQPPTSTAPNSGNKSNEPYKANAANKAIKANGIWTGLILGLVLVAVALGIGLWWQQQRFESVAKEVATRLQQSDQQASQASERASQALTLATAQREVVDQLRRELSVANNDLAALQQAWESANEGLDQTLLLNDLKRLITMANQELVLFGNVNSAVSILSSVDTMLQTQSAPALKNLQQAVIQDLARLRAVPQVDVASLSARLDSLIQLTNKAPLLAPAGANNLQGSGEQDLSVSTTGGSASGASESTSSSTSPSTTSTDGGTDTTAWWSSWDTATGQVSQWSSEASEVLMREFANVLSIRKADDPQALLLSEEQAMQLKANVRAMLLSAQLALMTRQAEIWRSELTEVQSLLNTRYDTDALDTKASLQLLGELLQAPLAADVPQIAQTLNALASAERVVTIPAADSASTDQQSTVKSTEESTDNSATESATESTTEPKEQITTAPAAATPAAETAAQGATTEASGGAADTASTSVAPSVPTAPSTSSANTEKGS